MAFASNEEMSYVVANGFRHGMVLVYRATLALVFCLYSNRAGVAVW